MKGRKIVAHWKGAIVIPTVVGALGFVTMNFHLMDTTEEKTKLGISAMATLNIAMGCTKRNLGHFNVTRTRGEHRHNNLSEEKG